MPLKFNTLLEEARLDPKKVYLLRHQDSGKLPKGKIFSTWISERKRFESFQEIQKWKNRFSMGSALASFIVDPDGETLFVGIYEVVGRSHIKTSIDDPLFGALPAHDRALHQTKHLQSMKEYEGKLVIEWGRGFKAWRQNAQKNNKLVLEIRPKIKEEQFPGYINFSRLVADLRIIPHQWKDRLKDVRGIYLLTFSDGQQYIGSASGKAGFWQRWADYVQNGHGGNRVLKNKSRDARNAVVSILEFTGSSLTRDEVIGREMVWQRKLGSRAERLNDE